MGLRLMAEKLRRLRKRDFELFCRVLLDADYRARFSPKAVDIAGPHLEDVPDGGRDLEAMVRAPPHTQTHNPLLRDDPGEMILSCKSHKDDASPRAPKGWVDQVRDDLDPSPRIYNARTKAIATNAPELAGRTGDGLKEVLRRLCEDNCEYCVLVNVGAVDRLALAREFALRLRIRAKLLFGSDVDIRDEQVWVLDANELVNVFNERRCTLPPDLEAQLGGPDEEFRSWVAWTEYLEAERRRMEFVYDQLRTALFERLDRLVESSSSSTLWVVGAPGVGKTRAVYHFFEQHSEFQSRVRQTDDWEQLYRWLQRDGIRSMTDVLLVADEIPPTRGDALAREFVRSAAGTGAKLIMIGTCGEGQEVNPPPFTLDRIESEGFRGLIQAELNLAESRGAARDQVLMIVERLSQGYPLFAMWLTRGLANNPELLDDPGSALTDDHDPWLATSLVLASRSGLTDEEWKANADRRGRALLLVMLTPHEDWSFSPGLEDTFARALGMNTWSTLENAANDCRKRGLLRRTLRGGQYISPANLERLIFNHFFGGMDPPLRPRRLRKLLGARVDNLLLRAQQVGASSSCRRALADGLLDDVLDDLRREGASRHTVLRHIAQERPTQVAHEAHKALCEIMSDNPELAEGFISTFRHLRHRALDQGTFALVEDALFMLGGRDPGVGTGAAGAWAEIFSSGIHATYQPFEFRIGLLESHLSSADPRHRIAAVFALGRTIDPHCTKIVLDAKLATIDRSTAGAWETPDAAETARRAARGWELLLQSTSDPDQEVRDAACRAVTNGFRRGLRYGLWARPDLVYMLEQGVRKWTPSQRNGLGVVLDDIDRYDTERLGGAPSELVAALGGLRVALRPNSFRDRLLVQVGRWHPISGSITAPERRDEESNADRVLATECVANPSILFEQEDWLNSQEAVRISAFGWALGEVDINLTLRTPLQTRVEGGKLTSLMTNYLAAWAKRAPAAFDGWLEQQKSNHLLADVIAMTIIGSPSSVERAEVLVSLVESGAIRLTSLRGLSYWGRAEGLPVEVIDRLIAAASSSDDEVAAQTIGLAGKRVKRGEFVPPNDELYIHLLHMTRSRHLPGTGERDWAAVLLALVEWGRVDAIDVVRAALSDVGYSHQAEQAIRELLDRGYANELWDTFAPALESDPVLAISFEYVTSQTSFREQIPVEVIMAWVSHRVDRGVTAAHLTTPYASVLDPLAHALIGRFGADSDPAREVAARVGSSRQALGSTVKFYEQQADNAAEWSHDPNKEVSRWASRLVSDFRLRAAVQREEDELMRQLG